MGSFKKLLSEHLDGLVGDDEKEIDSFLSSLPRWAPTEEEEFDLLQKSVSYGLISSLLSEIEERIDFIRYYGRERPGVEELSAWASELKQTLKALE